MVTPTFKILRLLPSYRRIPESKTLPNLKNFVSKILTLLICVLIAYSIPNLTHLLNFQGALTGVLMTFFIPILCFQKTFGSKGIALKELALCYSILLFGFIGGSVSIAFSLQAMVNHSYEI